MSWLTSKSSWLKTFTPALGFAVPKGSQKEDIRNVRQNLKDYSTVSPAFSVASLQADPKQVSSLKSSNTG